MKKLVFLLALLPLLAISQKFETRSIQIPQGQFPSRADWTCPDNSIFSQTFGFQMLYTSDTEYGYKVYDNYSVSGNFNTVSFWGCMLNFASGNNCTDGLSYFNISFYEDNNGAIGDLITSFELSSVSIEYVATGFGIDTYLFTASLGTVYTIQEGWISIQGTYNDGTECVFLWCDSYDGDLNAYQENGEGWVNNDFAVCLSMSGEVPISNWAVGIGAVLMMSFLVFRFRRLF